MFTRSSIVSVAAPKLLPRRSLLEFVLIVAPLGRRALAETAPTGATAVIKHFNEALLAAMKAGGETNFIQRFQALAPEVD